MKIELGPTDALVIVDVQNDFLPGGALAVPQGDEVIPVLNRYIAAFDQRNLLVYSTRDWHPENHCSFKEQGGPWPVHCVVGTEGVQFSPLLELPVNTVIISKPSDENRETYSAFVGTDFEDQLRAARITRVFVGGLATDYCVYNTVKDALAMKFSVCLLLDAIKGVNVNPDDSKEHEEEMQRMGAVHVTLADIPA